jgi:hypothetical protein
VNIAQSSPAPAYSRLSLYGAAVLAFVVLTAVAAALFAPPNPRLLYAALLLALCASPILYARKLNDRYALYTIFLVIYFVSFGMLDVVHLFEPTPPDASPSILSSAELLILLAGGAFALGYHYAVNRRTHRGISQFVADDWPMTTLLTVGLILWAGGTFATWYWNVQLTVRSLEVNYASEGITTLLMIGRYAQPLGILILVYAYTLSRSAFLTCLVITIVAIQVVLGFVSNTKGLAMLGGILVIVTIYLVRGKVAKTWLIAALLFITFAFPVFQAYRTVVVGERGVTNAEAARDIGSVLRLAIEGERRNSDSRVTAFFERSSVKSAVELMVSRVGVDVAYQHGHTLSPMLTVFIPRLIWPTKPSVETGLLLNEEFHIADAVVYISPSYLGELYWNFGWSGALIGLLIIGLLLGYINVLCDLSTGISVTRLLLLAISIFEIGVRFEGSIATEYEVWLRSVAGILLLHLLLSRPGLRRDQHASIMSFERCETDQPSATALGNFPNIMS